MENQKKKQERELRALTQEELVSINGGETLVYVLRDGKIIVIVLEDKQ